MDIENHNKNVFANLDIDFDGCNSNNCSNNNAINNDNNMGFDFLNAPVSSNSNNNKQENRNKTVNSNQFFDGMGDIFTAPTKSKTSTNTTNKQTQNGTW